MSQYFMSILFISQSVEVKKLGQDDAPDSIRRVFAHVSNWYFILYSELYRIEIDVVVVKEQGETGEQEGKE